MEQTTDVRALVEQGDNLLIEGRVTDAAAAYTRAVQADPSVVGGHLGLAKAYLALGNNGYVYMAAQQVQKLAPGSADAAIAQAILFVLDRHYDAALHELDRAESLAPGNAYVHALRGYCYRRLNNSYDAMSAESKAARLSGHREWSHLFPAVETTAVHAPAPGQNVVTLPGGAAAAPDAARQNGPRPWDQRSALERQMVRARFVTRDVPIVTYTLMAINIAVYIACAAISGDFGSPLPARAGFTQAGVFVTTAPSNPIYNFGIEQGLLIQHDPLQAYRIFTAMFLHESIIHIGLNMLSLYFVGVITERLFGKWRFLLIYVVGGIIAGIAQAIVTPASISLGASGAIFAIFGAFGAFVLLYRRALGPAAGAIIGQWIFWLALNLYFSVSDPNIGLYDHLGGLIAGFVLGILLAGSVVQGTRRKR